jgi:hypothetical protein
VQAPAWQARPAPSPQSPAFVHAGWRTQRCTDRSQAVPAAQPPAQLARQPRAPSQSRPASAQAAASVGTPLGHWVRLPSRHRETPGVPASTAASAAAEASAPVPSHLPFTQR